MARFTLRFSIGSAHPGTSFFGKIPNTIGRLPDEFQRQLNLPRGNLRLNDLAELGISRSVCEDRLHRAATCVGIESGRRKVGSIQNIEHLRAELHVERFRDPWDVIVLQQGEINIK